MIKYYCYNDLNNQRLIPFENQNLELLGIQKFPRLLGEGPKVNQIWEIKLDDNFNLRQKYLLDVDYIKPEAFLAVASLNLEASVNISNNSRKESCLNDKYFLQEILDRALAHGDSYKKALEELNERFPINVEYVQLKEQLIRKLVIENK